MTSYSDNPRRYWTTRPLGQGESYVGPGGDPLESSLERALLYEAIEMLLADSPVYGTVLDFGCGSGRLAHRLSEVGETYIGVDISPTGIQLALQAPVSCVGQFIWMDTDRIPLPMNSVDLVVAAMVFQHIPQNLWKLWCGELRRVMKGSAHMLVVDALHGRGDHVHIRLPFDVEGAFRRKLDHVILLPDHWAGLLVP